VVSDPSLERLEQLFDKEIQRQGEAPTYAHARRRSSDHLGPLTAEDLAARVDRLEELIPAALGARLERLEAVLKDDIVPGLGRVSDHTLALADRVAELRQPADVTIEARVSALEEAVTREALSRIRRLETWASVELVARIERLEAAAGEPAARPDLDEVLAAVAELRDRVDAFQREAAQQPAAEGPGRNRPCPCGSGRKYKYCHGA
jgi:glycyl-tRNA synthetase beta subunit